MEQIPGLPTGGITFLRDHPGGPCLLCSGETPGLHPLEDAALSSMSGLRRRTWAAGRHALRLALVQAGGPQTVPLLSSSSGAPVLPPGYQGSLSHKCAGDKVVAAAIAEQDRGWSLGLDLELLDRARPLVERLVLTDREQEAVAQLPEEARWQATLLRFSLKEAAFKAASGFLGRAPDYREAWTDPAKDGTAGVGLADLSTNHNLIVRAWWSLKGPWIITTARARKI